MTRRVVVVGAGAAGTMAASFAADAGAETWLLERTRDGGRKILISGGGRCNVQPARLDESRYITDSAPNTLRKIIRSWPLAEQIMFFERDVGIPLQEEIESAKLFPVSQKARDVRDGLLALARRRGVRLVTDTRVTDIVSDGARWAVQVDGSAPIAADAVIVATGGLSVPATGSDGTGLRIVERLGHTLTPTYAALTPVTADPGPYTDLAGIALRVTLTATAVGQTARASGGFLFTHRGYSGPSVLDVSHVAVRARAEQTRATIAVQWTAHDETAWETLLRPQGARQVASVVRAELPDRLADLLLAAAHVDPARRLAELTRDERRRLVDTLVRGDLPWSGDEGYKKAEVMGGGVTLSEIDPRTMESRVRPGLYLCGEVLDAFGPIGGYNFLWAWATGRAAGRAAGRALAIPAAVAG
ncbi:MAG: NAD(P)/FAD-dependent oxidoreductase [Gemmatimonas sp.]|uniref:NAD(P)/FAD-dependent oxidoreductase n=1 Tax=Gemmatimonas sp. TaxID=1962908 RepID=UPI00391F2DBE